VANTHRRGTRMRTLLPTRSGRLHGIPVAQLRQPTRAVAGNTPQSLVRPAPRRHHHPHHRHTHPDSPEYLVLSTNVVVVVLTAAANLVLPDTHVGHPAPATGPSPRRPRRPAPGTLRLLADHRAAMDDRPRRRRRIPQHPDGALRISVRHGPTTPVDPHRRRPDQARAAPGTPATPTPTRSSLTALATAIRRDRHGSPLRCCAHPRGRDTTRWSLWHRRDWLHAEGATPPKRAPLTSWRSSPASYLGRSPTDRLCPPSDGGLADRRLAAAASRAVSRPDAITRDWFSNECAPSPPAPRPHRGLRPRNPPRPAHADLPVVRAASGSAAAHRSTRRADAAVLHRPAEALRTPNARPRQRHTAATGTLRRQTRAPRTRAGAWDHPHSRSIDRTTAPTWRVVRCGTVPRR